MANATTQTKDRPQQRSDAQAPQSRGQVAVIQPPRLPYHDAVKERFGVDKAGWKVLCESVFPAAKTADSIVLALSYCKARRLDPFKKNIHIVPIWSSQKNAEVETVWPGIAEHRTTATRTGTYAGLDLPRFGQVIEETFTGRKRAGKGPNADWKDDDPVTVKFPEWCEVTVYRMVQGQRVPFPGPRVYWREFYSRKSRWSTIPNEQWAKRPSQMLEKCAEAGALRRAFPEELGEEWTVDEAGAFAGVSSGANARPVEAEVMTTDAAEPKRSDFTEHQNGDLAEDREPAADDTPARDHDEHSPPASETHPNGAGSGAAADQSGQAAVVAGGVDSKPEGVAGQPPAEGEMKVRDTVRVWKIGDDIVGQDNKIAALNKLLMQAEFAADCDEIEKQNAEFIGKTGRRQSEIRQTIARRRQVLAKGEE